MKQERFWVGGAYKEIAVELGILEKGKPQIYSLFENVIVNYNALDVYLK